MPEPVITTARTARHALPFLFPGQAQKEAFVNEALVRLDALVQLAVIDERTDPPDTPAPGDCYIVGSNPSGTWSGHARAIAAWAESQWLFTPASEGMRAFDQASGSVAVHSATAGWQRASAPPEPTGGTVTDAEARATLSAILANLRTLGIFS